MAIRFVDIAVRYVPTGEAAEKTLDFSISDHNTCSLLSLDDERERILGHRLLRHWGILREVRSPSEIETWRMLPVCLEIWNAGFDHVSGSWLRSRGIEASMLTTCGFLEPAGWEETSLIEEGNVGLADSKVIAAGGRSHLSVPDGQVSDGGPAARYRRFSVDQGWLIEHLRSAVSSALDRPYVEPLDDDLFGLGRLMVDGTEVPVYLARRLDDEKVLAASDTLLRSRGDQGLGLVLDAGRVAYRCVGANVLSKLVPHLTEGADGPALDVESMRMAFRSNRHLARGSPTECIVASQRPIITESGTLAIVNPPETRNDLTQYPGALTLSFGSITVNEVTFVPVGIWARYVTNSFDTTWLGGQPPILSVLYHAGGS